jgi:peptidoglycan/xylan/chitin deacetylase (PgdA/CDA1 family)
VVVPILLYHQIAPPKHNSRYYTSPEKFEEQLQLLHDWGYATITLEMLVKAIHEGADLPPRPMIISFDDGNINNYTTAFPIMRKYGYTGVLYIVGTYLGAELFMDADQVREMIDAGWEVGSHSMHHSDLTAINSSEQLKYEVFQSRKVLEEKLGVPILSFAYPFGFYNSDTVDMVQAAGYTTAVTVGYTSDQGLWNILALQRRDVSGRYDLKQFASFLPWQGDASFLPTDTPTPMFTPTRTPRVTATP